MDVIFVCAYTHDTSPFKYDENNQFGIHSNKQRYLFCIFCFFSHLIKISHLMVYIRSEGHSYCHSYPFVIRMLDARTSLEQIQFS